ncbi:MAG: glycosyl transferase [Deltaproteobacteria bacterium]|nr:glycosyl transferase [Deltaproteobacteria bacterium]
MKIILYCQYVWGMGHLFRSLELARAFSGHQVILIAGGREVDIELPEHVSLVRLPGLYMDEKFTTLMAEDANQSVEFIQHQRKVILMSLFQQHRPDVFMIELYPFGRTIFGFELQPLLDWIHMGRFGDVKVVCSLRDILVEKRKQEFYEERVINMLHTYFDLLLVHSDDQLLTLDETFSRMSDIRIPVVYTGFVAPKANPAAGRQLRRELGIGSAEKLVVVSAGGGRSGYALLNCIMDAYPLIKQTGSIRVEMFAGPFREPDEFEKLAAKAVDGIRIRHYTKRFLDYLSAADLSISLAGYNTCMNLIAARVPALIYPYSKQQEQPLRVAKIDKLIPMKILRDKDIEPQRISRYIHEMFLESRPAEPVPVNLDGAVQTAKYLEAWIGR